MSRRGARRCAAAAAAVAASYVPAPAAPATGPPSGFVCSAFPPPRYECATGSVPPGATVRADRRDCHGLGRFVARRSGSTGSDAYRRFALPRFALRTGPPALRVYVSVLVGARRITWINHSRVPVDLSFGATCRFTRRS